MNEDISMMIGWMELMGYAWVMVAAMVVIGAGWSTYREWNVKSKYR